MQNADPLTTARSLFYNAPTNLSDYVITLEETNALCYLSLGVRVFLTVLLILFIIFSISGSLLICGIVYRRAAMRSGINLLLASFALSDFLNAVINIPLTLVALNMTNWPFGDFLCHLNGLWFYMINAEKVVILLVISIDRYFIIVRRKDTMTPVKAKIFILMSWCVGILVALPPLVGWGSHIFRCGFTQCLLDFNNHHTYNSSYTIFVTTIIIIVPTFLLTLIYHRILRTVRRNCRRVQNHPPITPTAMHKKGRLFIDYNYKTRTSTTILLLSIVYICTVLPVGITNLYLVENNFNQDFRTCNYIAVLCVLHLHGVLNPLIYYSRIAKFRESVRDIWPEFCVHPQFIPIHSRRRIRPHVMYQVERSKIFVLNNSSSM